MQVFIKNMVCTRCIIVVKQELDKLGLEIVRLELGKAELAETPCPAALFRLRIVLMESGLELIEKPKQILIERIKNVLLEMIYHFDGEMSSNYSDLLARKLNLDYTYLANSFSESERTTIEQFVIFHKIKRVKELLGNSELTLTQISWKLNYSSVAHLSSQFKKVTGVTPSLYKYQMQPA